MSPGAGGGAAARDPSRDGFIALLDMFGFENAQVNQLEQLCMNLASETLQHFYTRHVFRTPQDACAEERIHNDVHAAYQDNAELIQLVSSQVLTLSVLSPIHTVPQSCVSTPRLCSAGFQSVVCGQSVQPA